MDWAVFTVAAIVVLAGALGVVLSANPVHSALMLVMTLFGVAVLFVAQEAHFLAAVQVIVYAGAIVVLFLFVLMLLGVDRSENVSTDGLRGQRPLAILAGLAVLAGVLLLARNEWVTGAHQVAGPASGTDSSNVETLARSLFTRYLLAFEVTSVLLVIAVVGAVVLVRNATPDHVTEGTPEVGRPSPPDRGDGPPSAPGRGDGWPVREGPRPRSGSAGARGGNREGQDPSPRSDAGQDPSPRSETLA